MTALTEAVRLLTRTLDLSQVLQRLIELAQAQLSADAVGIWLLDQTAGEIVLAAQVGLKLPEMIARIGY